MCVCVCVGCGVERRRPGKVAQPFILGRLTVRVVEGKGLRGPGTSMIFRPYVRVSLVRARVWWLVADGWWLVPCRMECWLPCDVPNMRSSMWAMCSA